MESSGSKIKLNEFVKRFLAVQVPLAILLAAALIYYYSAESGKHRQILESYESQILEQQGEIMASNFTTIVADLMFLTEYHELHDYLDTGNPDNRKRLANDWLSLSRKKGFYDQIRYIDNKGTEIIRINFNEGNPVIVSDDLLQNKAKRYYFMDTFGLNKGEVYVSPFDLNIERGEIELPVKPMIRFGTPVFDKDGAKRGIALLNYFGDEMLDKLRKKFVEHQGQPMLLNPDGYWLLGPRPEKEWGFMYENEITISKDYPDVWEQISTQDSGQIYGRDGLFTFNTVYPIMSGWKSSTGSPRAFEQSDTQINGESYFWKAVSFVPNERLLMAGRPLKKYLIMLYSVLFIVLSFVSVRFAQVSLKRKQADDALKESEARFRELADLLPQPICEIDKEGNFIYANQIGLKTFGYTHKDIDNGLNILQIFVPEERERVTRNIRKRLAEDEFEGHEYSMLKSDGSIFPALLYTAPIIRNGIAVGVRGALVNLTERKQVEDELRMREERYSNLFQHSNDGIFIHDLDGNILDINQKVLDQLEYSRSELLSMKVPDLHPPEGLEQSQKAFQSISEKGQVNFETVFKKKDGQPFPVEVSSSMFEIEGKKVIQGIVRDITERKQAKNKLENSEHYLVKAQKIAHLGHWTLDPATGAIDGSDELFRIFGLTREEATLDAFTEVVHPEDREYDLSSIRRGLEKGTPWDIEHRLKMKDGTIKWVHAIGEAKLDEAGNTIELLGIVQDITERKIVEDKILKSERQLRDVQQVAKLGFWDLNTVTGELYWSDETFKIYGFRPQEFVPSYEKFRSILHPDDMDFVQKHVDAALNKDIKYNIDFRFIHSAGEVRYLNAQGEVSRDEKGNAIRFLGTQIDITERKRAEDALSESEEKYQKLFSIAMDAVCIFDIQTRRLLDVNDAYVKLYGYSKEEVLELTTDDIRAEPEASTEAIKRSDETVNVFIPLRRHRKKDGTEILVEIAAGPFVWKGQRVMYAAAKDITERIQAEKTLRESEKFLQAIIDGVAEAIIIIGNDYRIRLMNRTAREQMAYSEEDSVTCHKASHHRDTPCVGVEHPCPLEKVRETGHEVTVMHQHYSNEGEKRYIEILASPLWGPEGSFDGIIETNRDITDRVNAQKELFESREFFKNIVELTNAIHWELDLAANKFTYVSPQSESILGYPPDAWTDFDFWANRIHPDDREWAVEYCKQLTEKLKGHEFVYRMISSEGKTVWLHDIIHVISENQKAVRLTGIMFNVTRTKEAEEQIKTSLKEKETLIKEIHHRVKNNLAVIQSLLKLQAIHIKDEKTKGLFNESQNRVRSMSMIHERLYKTDDLSTINFGEYIRSLATQLFRSYRIDPSLVKLIIDVPDLGVDVNTMIPCGLILNELVSNACKYAFPDDRKGELSVLLDKCDDEYSLIVKDDGAGLPENLDIYNTESLGMQIVTSLINQIKGKLEVDKEGGTKFSIKFREKPIEQ